MSTSPGQFAKNSKLYTRVGDIDAPLPVDNGVPTNIVPLQKTFGITTTAVQILPANPYRTSLKIQNPDAANPVWIFFGKSPTVAANSTGWKIALGTSEKWPVGECPTTEVWGISTTATVNVNIIEGSV